MLDFGVVVWSTRALLSRLRVVFESNSYSQVVPDKFSSVRVSGREGNLLFIDSYNACP